MLALALALALSVLAAPAPAVNREALLTDARVLSADDMEGRRVGTPGGAKARAYVARRLAEAGAKPLGGGWERPFRFQNRAGETIEGVNLVGLVRGTSKPDEYVVVSAHYDHLGVRDGEIYNGADDNASGVATLAALTAWFAANPPERSLLIVAFDAEEAGLQGARAFVSAPPVPRAALKLNVNLDMVGRSEKGELYVAGTHHTPALKTALEPVVATAKVTLLFGHDRPELGTDDWTLQSDHGAFHVAGVPFLYFGVEDHPGYHKPGDDFDALTPEFFVRAAETVIAAVDAVEGL